MPSPSFLGGSGGGARRGGLGGIGAGRRGDGEPSVMESDAGENRPDSSEARCGVMSRLDLGGIGGGALCCGVDGEAAVATVDDAPEVRCSKIGAGGAAGASPPKRPDDGGAWEDAAAGAGDNVEALVFRQSEPQRDSLGRGASDCCPPERWDVGTGGAGRGAEKSAELASRSSSGSILIDAT